MSKKRLNLWSILGPGFTTGAADDDPSGIATYAQTGAKFGLNLLWLAPFSFPLMAHITEMCARIGIVTGRGLSANIRAYFSREYLYLITILLFITNAFNIGADLSAMAAVMNQIFPSLNMFLLVLFFAVFSLTLQIFLPYRTYANYLKWLALALFAYIFSTLSIEGINWGEVMRATVTPWIEFRKETFIMICAILGTTISPYLFFWQTSQEVEERISDGKKTILARQKNIGSQQIRLMRLDVWLGMFFSNLVMFFIILATAATLNVSGTTDISSLSEAAQALRPFLGESSFVVFSLGIIGTGLLTVPVLAGSASYAVSESMGFKEGLSRRISQAIPFYSVIILSILVGVILNIIQIDPVKALVYSAVINGLVAPFVIFAIVRIASEKSVMKSYVNSSFARLFGWAVFLLMSVVAVGTIISLL